VSVRSTNRLPLGLSVPPLIRNQIIIVDAAELYDEVEGILPDGRWTVVESDREGLGGQGSGRVVIWKLSPDGKKTWDRPTSVNKYPGFKASNPVVIDGQLMAFQMARSCNPAGAGYGIFLFDFARAFRGR